MTCVIALALSLTACPPQATQSPSLPPADSPPLVRTVEIAFPTQENVSIVDAETYLYYIRTQPSRPSAGAWVPYDRQGVLDDFGRLWATNFLDDLWVDVSDEPYGNGVVGKHVTFNLTERPRVKLIEYEGSKVLEASKIDEALREAKAEIRTDSFLDASVVHRAEGVIRGKLEEKGYRYAAVTHRTDNLPGGLKTVRLTFHLAEGPKVQIRRIDFVGNAAMSDRALAGRMKTNKPRRWWWPSFLGGDTAYQETQFEEDADRIVQHYRDHGFIKAQVGSAVMRALRDSRDGRNRWVELRVPVTEGERYQVGEVSIDGNTVVKTEALRTLFQVRAGDGYNEKTIRKGFEKAREIYGAGGYYEFTGYPELKPLESKPVEVGAKGLRLWSRAGQVRRIVPWLGTRALELTPFHRRLPPPTRVVDVTMRMQEGRQYFVNRIVFQGNTVTRDNVVRREVGLVEGGVFSTEALKHSVRRLNQLAYFKPIEDQKGIAVDKTPGVEDKVDVTFKVEEQNRNQLSFGAGVSEYDGVFGNFSYTVANFMGRGESVTLALQRGSRSNLYQVGFSEPYLFDRPISAGIDVYSRKYNYYLSTGHVGYSEVREGATVSVGRLVRRYSRLYLSYTYEVVDTSISNDLLSGVSSSTTTTSTSSSTSASTTTTSSKAGLPSFSTYFDQGRHVDSRVSPTWMLNTVDNPIMPHRGMRVSVGAQVASRALGGSYDYLKPEVEMVYYLPTSRRTGVGVRGQIGWLATYGGTETLPYYLRYFLGGEYQIRGVDIRSVGPVDSSNRALGGNKFVLFNAEYSLDIVNAVRVLVFHDAGQAFGENRPIDLRQLRTSTGAEARFMVPMLNVPFRLIWAYNRYRDSYQPEFTFKFGVGATF